MLAHSGAFSVLTGGPKGPIWPKTGPNWEKSSGGQIYDQIWSLLSPIGLTGLQSWLPHTLAWCWDSSWPHRSPKRTRFDPKCPFWGSWRSSKGPERPDLVPTPANCSDWVGIIFPTHFGLVLGLFFAPRDQKRASFWPKMPLLGVLKVLGGPEGTRFGPKTPGLLCMGWNHSYNRLRPGIGPLIGGQEPQEGLFWHKMSLFDPKRAHMGPKFNVFANLLCDQSKLSTARDFWDQIWPLGALRGPPGPPKGAFWVKSGPFGAPVGPRRVPAPGQSVW